MAFVNQATREIQLKIVYYGPALSGKTTNLEHIHATIKSEHTGELMSLDTAKDRTLFFDFMPLVTRIVKGFKTRFQLYTVPGQVMYNTTRRIVLRGLDGLVFVADSQWECLEANVESFRNLQENLQVQGVDLDAIPYVLAYNKRDLTNIAPRHYMDFLLNNREVRRPSFESIAIEGTGVFDILNRVSQLVLHKLLESSDTDESVEQALTLG